MIEEKFDDDYISHKTSDYLQIPKDTHDIVFELNNGNYNQKDIKEIIGSKELFRANVQQIIEKVKKNNYKSEVFPLDFLEKMLKKSYFDWMNYNKFKKFEEWYSRIREENIEKLMNRNP